MAKVTTLCTKTRTGMDSPTDLIATYNAWRVV